ncbi:MAG: phospholipase D family protein [Desulfobacterales bacterium]|nr:phospholipase D family protein [Desulfobacterales bacterium]
MTLEKHQIIILLALGLFYILSAPVRADFPEIIKAVISENSSKSGAYILEKGEISLLSRAWLSENAEKTIDIQYFIWSTDNIGILAAEALLQAAERGVKIRVIVDDLLIEAAAEETIIALSAHPMINIRIYNPKHSVGISRLERIINAMTDFKGSNQRMHDKIFIADGIISIIGGRNMADEYFDYDHVYNFRDRDILLAGPVVSDIHKSFESFWESTLAVPVEKLLIKELKNMTWGQIEKSYKALHEYAQNPLNYSFDVRRTLDELPRKFPELVKEVVWDEIQFIRDTPGKNEEKGLGGGGVSTDTIISVLKKAEKSVIIQSPYLVMPKGGFELFEGLIKKGVNIKISTNSLAATDNLKAFSGYSSQRKKILKTGINVYEFRPDSEIKKELIERYDALSHMDPVFAIHAKSFVVDSKILYVGTFNFDPRSANLNTEIGVLINSSQLAKQVENKILEDILPENSWDAAKKNPDSNASLFKRTKVWFWKMMPIGSLL